MSRADELIDRRRLRRKLTFWRVLALAVAAAVVVAVAVWNYGEGPVALDHVAKVRIEGTITEDQDLLDLLEDVRESPRVRGVILAIDSPGGTTVGGEAIFEEVRRIAAEKPVVAQVGTLAASAGYMIASGADHIVARQSSIVGSIGVLIQIPNFQELLNRWGVRVDEVKSSPLKAEPSPFNETTPEERAVLQALINDSYDWFVGLVDERRPLDRGQVQALANGAIFTGRQALDLKLVDELGGEREAQAWLEGRGVPAGLDVVEWEPRDEDDSLFWSAAGRALGRLLGLPEGAGGWLDALGADRLFLDGLQSVWHPDGR